MIYSNHGHWKTFWNTRKDETYDTAEFGICETTTFTAKYLREHMDTAMDTVAKFDQKGDIDELRGYAEQFLRDIENKYETTNSE